ncbi:MAG TPA: helix-turn-helix transcriptional regulator [Thermoanaerobaculia bacterium]|nr:helix-turn-helix transcriptional regulator [Thermoanaerobaculia bacterium]
MNREAKETVRTPSGGRPFLHRRKPRDYEEWKALVSWGKLPDWETAAPGYRMRLAREEAGLTQKELAARLGVSQQAIARTERWNSNPTIRFLERWAEALGAHVEISVELSKEVGRETP